MCIEREREKNLRYSNVRHSDVLVLVEATLGGLRRHGAGAPGQGLGF